MSAITGERIASGMGGIGMLVKRFGLRVRFFTSDDAGASAVEYAVCLATIVAIALLAVAALGTSLRSTFSGTSLAQNAAEPGHVRNSATTVVAASRATANSASISSASIEWLIAVSVVLISGATVVWVRRQMAKPTPETDDAQLPIVPKELQAKFVAKRHAILHYLAADAEQLAHGQIAVRQVMSTSMLTKRPEESADELRELMRESTVRHLVVCSDLGELLGVISDRDISHRTGDRVADLMTSHPITVSPDTPVSTVTTIMLARRISCVPVIEEGRLLGIVTTSDLLMALQCVLRLIEQHTAPTNQDEAAPDSNAGDDTSPADAEAVSIAS